MGLSTQEEKVVAIMKLEEFILVTNARCVND